jgi:hypothetical protein
MKPSTDFNRMSNVMEAAELAFWDVVAKAYPEAKSGDLSPAATMEFAAAVEQVITRWLMTNADPVAPEWKTTEILLHNIEYNYDSDIEITDGDEEHIAYCISQGIREGELCTIVAVSTERHDAEVRGYWRINNG